LLAEKVDFDQIDQLDTAATDDCLRG
jgi:hypothetical protein